MRVIIAFSGNLKLNCLEKMSSFVGKADKIIIVTSHKLLENERLFVSGLFPGCLYVNFGEMLSDAENEECDKYAYSDSNGNAALYMLRLNALKNHKIVGKLLQKYPGSHGFLLSEDLGFVKDVWLSFGFQYVIGEYYHDAAKFAEEQRLEAEKKAQNRDKPFGEDVYVAERDGITYVFIGSIKRVADYMSWDFVKSPQMREELNKGNFMVKGKYQYLSTIHEKYTCPIPFHEMIDLRYVQDGYLPPNFSAYDLRFIPQSVSYYVWDALGLAACEHQGVSVKIAPFAKKIYMPNPCFPKKIKTVLIASNCAGSWSAQINRSDDDLLAEAVVLLAKTFPDINFVYRCHPSAIHPEHAGVNYIEKIAEYFAFSGLKNIRMSSNMPMQELSHFNLSVGSSSLSEDIKAADLVIGEYSHSLIEAAMEGKLFASVNLTNRRDFYECITNMGFPHCNSAPELGQIITGASFDTFKNSYLKAVERYNFMIDSGKSE